MQEGQEQKQKTVYTDREIWEFGRKYGFPEDPELSLFSSVSYDVFSEETDAAFTKAERDAAEKLAAAAAEKLAATLAAEAAEEAQTAETPADSVEIAAEETSPAEEQEADSSAEEQGKEAAEEAFTNEDAVEEPEESPGRLEAEILADPVFAPVVRHAVAAAMYPQNVFRLYADIKGEELRMRGAQPIQGGPSSAFGIFISAGAEGSFISAESPQSIRALVTELACVKAEDTPVSMSVSPLAQIALLAACDVVLETRFEGDRFTPSALLNTLTLSRDSDYRRLCAPLAEVVGERLRSTLTLEEMMQVMEELANSGVFIREKAGERVLYSFASAYRALPDIFAGCSSRFALCRYDIEGEGDILYILSEGTLSWAFIMEDKKGRIEKIDKEGLTRVLREIFPVSTFCTNCGTALPPGAKFCDQCGAKAE